MECIIEFKLLTIFRISALRMQDDTNNTLISFCLVEKVS